MMKAFLATFSHCFGVVVQRQNFIQPREYSLYYLESADSCVLQFTDAI